MKQYIIFILILLSSCTILKDRHKKIDNSILKDTVIQDRIVDNVDDTNLYGESLPPLMKQINIDNSTFNGVDNSINDNTNISSNNRVKNTSLPKSNILNSTNNTGSIVYKIPSEMTIRTISKVTVRISKSTVHIYENLDGEIKSGTIQISEKMEVKLIDPSGNETFYIVPDNNGEQIIDDSDSYTEWSWSVTPLKTGKNILKVTISIIRENGKKEIVFEDNVTVKMNIPNQLHFFFSTYWQWLFGTIIIPFVIWFYKKRNKNEGS